MFRFTSFVKFGEFGAIISSNILPLSLLSFWDSYHVYADMVAAIS